MCQCCPTPSMYHNALTSLLFNHNHNMVHLASQSSIPFLVSSSFPRTRHQNHFSHLCHHCSVKPLTLLSLPIFVRFSRNLGLAFLVSNMSNDQYDIRKSTGSTVNSNKTMKFPCIFMESSKNEYVLHAIC
jgi:hypothetical protein